MSVELRPGRSHNKMKSIGLALICMCALWAAFAGASFALPGESLDDALARWTRVAMSERAARGSKLPVRAYRDGDRIAIREVNHMCFSVLAEAEVAALDFQKTHVVRSPVVPGESMVFIPCVAQKSCVTRIFGRSALPEGQALCNLPRQESMRKLDPELGLTPVQHAEAEAVAAMLRRL